MVWYVLSHSSLMGLHCRWQRYLGTCICRRPSPRIYKIFLHMLTFSKIWILRVCMCFGKSHLPHWWIMYVPSKILPKDSWCSKGHKSLRTYNSTPIYIIANITGSSTLFQADIRPLFNLVTQVIICISTKQASFFLVQSHDLSTQWHWQRELALN